MIKAANLFSENTLSGGMAYFDYEVAIGKETLLPWLKRHLNLAGLTVGDFGCHQGGVLEALRRFGYVKGGMGFDLDEPSIRNSPFVQDNDFSLHIFDLTQLRPQQYQFDLILIRDVLEHIPNHLDVLKIAKSCLAPGGSIFISFPPYYSPFGGHQHEASNWMRAVPFLHYLPKETFFSMVQTKDTLYMDRNSSLEDMHSVADTRMTLAKAERTFREAGMRIQAEEHFLLRPEFKIRYGIPQCSNGPLSKVPILREIATMGVYYLLTAAQAQ
jgi:2-polyprenyl-3-methyl-5-hydroxy-6-metoxy-1,4-benzoquinol methylase